MGLVWAIAELFLVENVNNNNNNNNDNNHNNNNNNDNNNNNNSNNNINQIIIINFRPLLVFKFPAQGMRLKNRPF